MDKVFAMSHQLVTTSTHLAGGLGLGLSLAREIAQAHGVDARMESQVGKGSTCTIRLPLYPEGPPCD